MHKVGCLWKFFRGKFEIQDRHQGKDADGRQVYPMWLHLKHGGKFCKFCVFYEPLFTIMSLKTGLQGLPSIRGLEQGPTQVRHRKIHHQEPSAATSFKFKVTRR